MDNHLLKKKISDAVEQERGRLLELCERLINIESVTGNERIRGKPFGTGL